MIELDHVSHSVGGRRIVDDVTLTVASGEFCALVGSSGSGKSTTLKMINRLAPVSEGAIRIDGKDIAQANAEELRRSIGYVIQSIGLFPHWNVADNIATVPRLLGWPEDNRRRRVDGAARSVAARSRPRRRNIRTSFPAASSSASAWRARWRPIPNILLMDEPFGALDPITRAALQDGVGRDPPKRSARPSCS